MAEAKMDLKITTQLTVTEETAETCTWLLTKYLNANPDKTVKVITKPGGDGFVRKVEIVPEWGETKKEKAEMIPCSFCVFGVRGGQRYCTNPKSRMWSNRIYDGKGCEQGKEYEIN